MLAQKENVVLFPE